MISQEEIKSFLEGNDPEQHIVAIEFDYATDSIYKIKEPPGQAKIIKKDNFTAFAWVGDLKGINFYQSSKALQKEAMSKYGIMIEKLETKGNQRLEDGLKFMVKSLKGYRSLIQFFRDGGADPWGERTKDLIMVLPPVEQYLIQKEKRLFKGYEEYNDITRFVFDLETTALEPKDGRIFMIGLKTNKGFQKVIECSDEEQERAGLVEFFRIIDEIKPTIIGGYNSANFDWYWIFERCKALHLDVKKICRTLNPNYNIKQSENLLKLANEVEKYNQVGMWGYNVIDILHSVRRAQAINSSIKSAGLKYITQYIEAEAPDRVYIPHEDIGAMYRDKNEYWLNITNGKYKRADKPEFDNLDVRFPGTYIKVTGDNIVERYLDDDLEETLLVDEQFNQGTFLLASMVPTTYERVSTMGTATLWKMLMLAWSYKFKLAIPKKQQKADFVGGLSRLLKVGYSKSVLKLDYSSLYPSIQLVHDVFPDCDVTGAMKGMLSYFRNTRIMYKNLAGEWYEKDKKKSLSYDRKQLPIKIFINSMFGALSAPQVFAWGDMFMGEQITCTGRQYLRMMIKFFMKKGYTPLLMDTDGINWSKPDGVEDRIYIGKGLNWKVKKDKEYRGDDADVAEFNDTFMKGEMALDTDGTWPSCINLARKNYAVMDSKGKIKLTGNTIKSKKLPLYIEDFLDKGVKYLLEGKGQEFVEWYYEYLSKIYNKEIPLMKIAQRAKVKLSMDDYIKRSKQKTKAGGAMSMMAHMELVLKHKLNVNLGDVIYYVNNGNKASQGDVQKVNRPKKGWNEEQINLFLSDSSKSNLDYKQKEKFLINNGWEKSWSDDNWVRSDSKNKEANTGIPTDVAYKMASAESIIQINCYMLDAKTLENNPGMTGDYNVARAITTFNKRIEPLLIVFKDEVRDGLLVDKPEDRGLFTKDQCELINGHPFEPEDQDSLDEVLKLSEGEVKYWEKRGIDPNYIYELAEPGWEKYIH
jgi:DNA polymerase elongation subunit (family B)